MDWQRQLITIYLYICKEYEQGLWAYAQRFGSHADLRLTDEEVISIYWFGILGSGSNMKNRLYFDHDMLPTNFLPHVWQPSRGEGRARYYMNDWGAYERHLETDKHEIGKRNTQKIERKNLNLRTWIKRLARKTICFS